MMFFDGQFLVVTRSCDGHCQAVCDVVMVDSDVNDGDGDGDEVQCERDKAKMMEEKRDIEDDLNNLTRKYSQLKDDHSQSEKHSTSKIGNHSDWGER